MTREEAHKLVDLLFDRHEGEAVVDEIIASAEETPARTLPEGKRVIRTKSSGDRVYLLDEEKKTRQWVTNGDVLGQLGFLMEDVVEVEDDVLYGYQMGSAIYKVNEPA